MPAANRKFKQTVPSEKVPAFLRSLADAFEGRTKNLAPLVGDLSAPLTRLEIKAKAGAGIWEFKVKIRTAAAGAPATAGAAESIPAAEPPAADYKPVKKQLKIAFDAIRRSIAARRLPEPEVMRAFLSNAEDMLAFTGRGYGEPHYEVFRRACRQLADAYETGNWQALQSSFAALAQLKSDCHRAYKGGRRPVV